MHPKATCWQNTAAQLLLYFSNKQRYRPSGLPLLLLFQLPDCQTVEGWFDP